MINSAFAPNDITLVVSSCNRGSSSLQSYTTSNSRTISGWTALRLTRGIERCPSDFEVSFTERYPRAPDVMVQPGDEVEVYLGTDVVLSGFVDVLAPSFNHHEHTVRIAGRSRSQDIVDCSSHYPGLQILNQPVDKIAALLFEPYGIGITVADGTNIGDPIPIVNVFPGDTPYNVVERVCR